jgi:PPOX class probable FMN-dependent enzyme
MWIEDEESLRALIGEPRQVVRDKVCDRLNGLTRRFIELSPFLCLATSDRHGRCDVSPRGDPRGFVSILDDRRLFLPERPGNKLADSLRNLLQNPQLGLLFLIPGAGDSFRVNGRGRLTTDPQLLAACRVEGKLPQLGILVDIEEAYTQCPKAILRSHLWDPGRFLEGSSLPSGGEILRSIQGDTVDARAYDQEREQRYRRRDGFY